MGVAEGEEERASHMWDSTCHFGFSLRMAPARKLAVWLLFVLDFVFCFYSTGLRAAGMGSDLLIVCDCGRRNIN